MMNGDTMTTMIDREECPECGRFLDRVFSTLDHTVVIRCQCGFQAPEEPEWYDYPVVRSDRRAQPPLHQPPPPPQPLQGWEWDDEAPF